MFIPNLGAPLDINVQSADFCDIPQYKTLGLAVPIGVCAKLFLRTREGRLEGLVHGLDILTQADSLYDTTANRPTDYNVPTIHTALQKYGAKQGATSSLAQSFFTMVCFDALIGGTDRHHWNWGVIEDEGSFKKFAPLFDNGVSLLWDIDVASKYRQVISHSMGMRLHKARSRIRLTQTQNGSLYDVVSAVGVWPEVEPSTIEHMYEVIADLDRGEKLRHAVVDKLCDIPARFLGGSRDPLEWAYNYVNLRRIRLLEILDSLRSPPPLWTH